MRFLRTQPPLILFSFGVVFILLVCALTAQTIAPHDIAQVDLRNRFQPPVGFGGDWRNPLGTDSLGRDVLSLILRGIQVSMTIAAIGTIVIAGMVRAGYPESFAAGVIANAGTLGILIPPSIVMLVYSAATEVSAFRSAVAISRFRWASTSPVIA